MGYPDNFSFDRYDEAQGTDDGDEQDGHYKLVSYRTEDGTFRNKLVWTTGENDDDA